MTTQIITDPETGEQVTVDLTPEEQAAFDQMVAQHGKGQATQQFAVQEDGDRLALVRERAATDPAFAALVDLTLGTKGVQR